jgi:xanthine dehydrogenase YagT iron-sulfur-binding subunit
MTEADVTRVEAAELAETVLTVNGEPVRLRLPPRVTLADALRDHLGLTGTHLGCEHGVCGMCTVLVDGQASRSCLLFACQLDGAEVVTVEGLSRPGELHPLQRSFGERHALQCGFCTPAFLLSAYDLLSRRPDVPDGELPAELSGVLCRCTGYRNILTAVGEVAAEYRDGGLPAPGNCVAGPGGPTARARSSARVFPGGSGSVSLGTSSAPPSAQPAAAGAGPEPAGAGPEPSGDGPVPPNITLPAGPPTFTTTVASTLAVSPAEVWQVLADVHLVARCLPGAELTEDLGADRYRGRARVGVGPVRLSFQGLAQVIDRDPETRALQVIAQGRDAGGAQTQAEITVRADPAGHDGGDGAGGEPGCRLTAEARVYLTGRIAQFGRALAGDVSRRLFEQFAAAVEQAARTGETGPSRPPASPSAVRLLLGAVTDRLRALLGRSRG